jgi:hypothetical protein
MFALVVCCCDNPARDRAILRVPGELACLLFELFKGDGRG